MSDEAAIEFYLNEGWDGQGIAPYRKLIIGECALATQRTARMKRHPDAPDDVAEFREIILAEARKRWLAGLYADPFTRTPRKRQCL